RHQPADAALPPFPGHAERLHRHAAGAALVDPGADDRLPSVPRRGSALQARRDVARTAAARRYAGIERQALAAEPLVRIVGQSRFRGHADGAAFIRTAY